MMTTDSDQDSHVPLSTSPESVTAAMSSTQEESHDQDASDLSDIDSDPELENWIQEATVIRT